MAGRRIECVKLRTACCDPSDRTHKLKLLRSHALQDLLEPLLTPTSGDPIVFRLTLQLNGAPRTVHVDSLLPVTLDGEPLGISDTAQSSTDSSHGEGDLDVEDGWGLRLLEKGWMTLRGGWESAGSNSSIDLHALTGWVPEILALKEYVLSLIDPRSVSR